MAFQPTGMQVDPGTGPRKVEPTIFDFSSPRLRRITIFSATYNYKLHDDIYLLYIRSRHRLFSPLDVFSLEERTLLITMSVRPSPGDRISSH